RGRRADARLRLRGRRRRRHVPGRDALAARERRRGRTRLQRWNRRRDVGAGAGARTGPRGGPRSADRIRAAASRRAAAFVARDRQSRIGARLDAARGAGAGTSRDIRVVRRAPGEPGACSSLIRNVITLALPMLPVPLQTRAAVPGTPLELVLNASTTTQVVLIILACLSLLSSGIMLAVGLQVGRAARAADAFSREFDRASRLDEAGAIARRAKPGALPRLFMHAM